MNSERVEYERRQHFTLFTSSARKEFFFSTRHLQRCDSKTSFDDSFVAVSFGLPMQVVARPSLPDGLIDTIEKYIMIFHADEKEIPNPDPFYTPAFRRVSA